MNNMDELYYNNIRDALKFREGTVHLDADGNLLSLAVLSEGFYCQLLNALMDWNLINANREKKNAPGIDLIDRDRKIAVQVSLTCDHEKVQLSIDKFKQDSYDGWHFYFVQIKRDAPRFRKDFKLPEGLLFDKTKDVLTTDRILRLVQECADIDKLKTVSQLMDEYTNVLPSHEALCKRLYKRLCKVRDHHPSFRLMGEDGIDKYLFPHTDALIPALGDAGGRIAPIWDHIKSEQKEGFRHIVVEGAGGIGKTVSLLSVTEDTELLSRIPAIYIHMYDLVYDGNCLTLPELLAHNADHNQIDRLCSEGDEPSLMLLLDGLNEVSYDHQKVILSSIQKWSEGHPGAQLVFTSRPIPGRRLENLLDADMDMLHISLRGLEEPQIKERLTAWEVPLPNESATIWETLKLPLFLTLYAKTAKLPERTSEGYPLAVREVTGQASLIWNYLQRELLRKDDEIWPVCYAIVCEYVAPYIAYRMVEANTFELDHDNAEQLVDESIRTIDMTNLPEHLKKVNAQRRHRRNRLPETDWVSFVLEQSGIFAAAKHREKDEGRDKNDGKEVTEDEYAFIHQNFRDCLAGLYLVNQAEMTPCNDLPESWKKLSQPSVLDYAAELIHDEEAIKLWNANRTIQPTDDKATITLLELQKRLHNDSPIDLNLSGMDLRGISLVRYCSPDNADLHLFGHPEVSNKTVLDINTLKGQSHYSRVTALTINREGLCISASNDGTLRIWDMVTGQCFRSKVSLGCPITCIASSLDGDILYGLDTGSVRKWNINSKTVSHIGRHRQSVSGLFQAYDGRIVSGSYDGTIRIWKYRNGRSSWKTLRGHTGPITGLAGLSNGNCISGSVDCTLRIWDIDNNTSLFEKTLKNRISAVSVFSKDGKDICISGESDGTIKIWDSKLNEISGFSIRHNDEILSIVESSEGACISVSADGTILIWDPVNGVLHREIKHRFIGISSIATSKIGAFACGYNDGTLQFWDSDFSHSIHTIKGQANSISKIVAPSEIICASSSDTTSIQLWNHNEGKLLYILNGCSGKITALATSGPNNCIAGTSDGSVAVLDINTREVIRFPEKHSSKVTTIATNTNGLCISGSDDGKLFVWDSINCKLRHVLDKHILPIAAICINSDGLCVSSSKDRTPRDRASTEYCLYVWNANNGEYIKKLEGFAGWGSCLTFVDDFCVCELSFGKLRFWDILTGEIIYTKRIDNGRPLSISSEGFFCIEDNNEDLRIYNYQQSDYWSGREYLTLTGHTRKINSIAINGTICLTGSEDGTIRKWNLKTGECINTITVSEIDVSQMDFRLAKMDKQLTKLLWQNGARLSSEQVQNTV